MDQTQASSTTGRRRIDEAVRDYLAMREDYTYDGGDICTEEDEAERVKWVIANRLTQADRVIITMYADYLNYRKLGRKLGFSHMTIKTQVLRIRRIIKEELDKL